MATDAGVRKHRTRRQHLFARERMFIWRCPLPPSSPSFDRMLSKPQYVTRAQSAL